MDSKDARESLESGGGGARCRCGNGRRSAAAMFVIQSLLTAAFATFSLYVFLNPGSTTPRPQKDNGIYMQLIDLDELKFSVIWNQTVELRDESKVKLSCGGPYMVYMWACMNIFQKGAVANLTMMQKNKMIHLQKLHEGCQQMQSVLMLSEKSDLTLKVEHQPDTIKFKKLTIGLHYMLGAQCFLAEEEPQ